MMESIDNPKLKKLLLKLLDPEFKVKNDTYLNALLDHLKESQGNNYPRLNRDSYISWLTQALKQWESQKQLPPSHILAFALNLSILHATEETFVKLNSENVFERLIDLVKKTIIEPRTALNVKLSYIKLLISFLNHKSGIHFLLSTNYWSQIIDFISNSDTIYIRKEGCRFIALLLQKSTNINEWFCYSVLQTLTAPLMLNIEEKNISKDLTPTLIILDQIFAYILEICGPKCDVKVFKIILDKFAIENQIRHLQTIIKSEETVSQLSKILLTMAFFDFVLKLGGRHKDIHLGEAKVASQKMFDLFLDVATRGPVANFLKLLYVGLVYWQQIIPIMPQCKTPESIPVLFEVQLMSLQLFPIAIVNMKFLGTNTCEDFSEDDGVKEQFRAEMAKYLTTDTYRTAFKWRHYLEQNFSFDHATLALKYVLQSRKLYSRETAKVGFQMIIHSIHDLTKFFQKHPQHTAIFARENNYLCILLETLTTIINDFAITWKDCVESICVMDITFSLLSYPVWSSKFVVRDLKLMEIAISKYMSPNMALLVDTTNDTVINIVGPILYAKTHDTDWEVRDSALDIIRTISHFAKKFPSLRETILDADFPSITLKMAKGDMEPYVRAGAFKCLQEMVEVNEIWSNLLKNDNAIIDHLIQSLHQESEGIVRKEIAALISILYESQEIAEDQLSVVYDIMSHAVMIDLYWEVKVNALKFWHKVLERHLMHQGVIDGSFPKITFSKEHRKIVNLNEVEIRRRLVKVLNQLSEIGCLAVFISALQDECDVEVSKTAVKLTKNFVEMLKQYNINIESLISYETGSPKGVGSPEGRVSPKDSGCYFIPQNSFGSPQSSYSSPQNNFVTSQNNNFSSNNSPNRYDAPTSVDSQYNSPPSSQIGDQLSLINQDTIIDDILDAQDMKLLETVFNSTDTPVNNSVEIKRRTVINPRDFLNVISSNFDNQVTQKAQWIQDIDNFNSLLDDILSEYEPSDVNNMDCY